MHFLPSPGVMVLMEAAETCILQVYFQVDTSQDVLPSWSFKVSTTK